MENQPLRAAKQKKVNFAGKGVGLQLLAIILVVAGLLTNFIILIIAAVLAIPLFIAGSNAATRWLCGNCLNRLDSKAVKICPICHAELT